MGTGRRNDELDCPEKSTRPQTLPQAMVSAQPYRSSSNLLYSEIVCPIVHIIKLSRILVTLRVATDLEHPHPHYGRQGASLPNDHRIHRPKPLKRPLAYKATYKNGDGVAAPAAITTAGHSGEYSGYSRDGSGERRRWRRRQGEYGRHKRTTAVAATAASGTMRATQAGRWRWVVGVLVCKRGWSRSGAEAACAHGRTRHDADDSGSTSTISDSDDGGEAVAMGGSGSGVRAGDRGRRQRRHARACSVAAHRLSRSEGGVEYNFFPMGFEGVVGGESSSTSATTSTRRGMMFRGVAEPT
ncbi:hypothetical protein BD410DRAFT_801511 [Rickenella mellea]|uniref:Uncharacterized protein n=1 Tax=Rickenella mellea TaxID=50990 RepID=A0A4Y7QBY8_9AGAM|nr:hypothetical protein BD410DRAFT_801511 [Rickenella mellea]